MWLMRTAQLFDVVQTPRLRLSTKQFCEILESRLKSARQRQTPQKVAQKPNGASALGFLGWAVRREKERYLLKMRGRPHWSQSISALTWLMLNRLRSYLAA